MYFKIQLDITNINFEIINSSKFDQSFFTAIKQLNWLNPI